MKNVVDKDCPSTGRNLGHILRQHRLTPDFFSGQDIIDLGCGKTDLQGDLAAEGISSRVVGIEAREDVVAIAEARGSQTTYHLANLGGRLPLPRHSFDVAIASWSFPMWARTRQEARSFYNEVSRIVRPLGTLSIYPIAGSSMQDQIRSLGRNWDIVHCDGGLLQAQKKAPAKASNMSMLLGHILPQRDK